MKGTVRWLACFCFGVAALGYGEDFGSIGLGYAWLHQSGNRNAFASQYDLSQGLFLESLQLDLRHVLAGFDRFEVNASGFGGDPFQHASLKVVDWDREWALNLDYTRREVVLPSPSLDLALAGGAAAGTSGPADGGRFSITRWTSSLTWDGWKAARLRLDLRDVQRSGSRLFSFYGLGAPYVARTSLDERVQEAGISLETRAWPVKVLLEQDITKYSREPRGAVGNNGQPLAGTDPDVLATYTTGRDSNTVPTTRLSAVYNSGRFEFVGQGLYRRDRLHANNNNDLATYAIDGGKAGQIGYLDALMGSADTDTKLADLRLGFVATGWLTLRARGHWADVSTDSTLVGLTALQLAGPGGTLDFSLPIDDRGYLDRTDKDIAAEADLHSGPFGLVVAYHDGSREIAWLHGADYTPEGVTRDARGWSATASLALGRTLTAQVGYDDSSFERYVFRTDPKTVTRLWAKLSARPAAGWEIDAHGSRERMDNPSQVAALNRPTDALGVAATYTAAGGAFASLSVDSLKLTSDVAISYWAPLLTASLSHYETDLLTTSLRASLPIGTAVRLTGGGLYIKDRGESAPFTSKAYDLEVEVPGPFATRLAIFGNHWMYDLRSLPDQNYDVTRYGVSVRRRF
ncbi:MAG: hypothetical protein B7Z61_04085 [Acidobacteria bacterium 37-71-11]|nr:MAG: hypothetical protein B7Z61_04085 [Acidobacteria bacterium 37-71-11]HQT94540.1 hypothetical protein [Thermoanaerobaculaceae bacterium]